MSTPVDELTQTLKQLRKPIDIVMKQSPGPRRWRLAHDLLWKNMSTKNQQTYYDVCLENQLMRESVDKFGQAIVATRHDKADKSLRNYLNIPVGAYTAIEKADPNVFKEKSNAKKFFEEFREYSTRKVF